MEPREIVRHKIKELREAQHLTQADMAEKLGLSVTGYAKIERGQSQIKPDRLQQIANIFNVSVQELMSPKDDAMIVLNNSNDNFNNSSLTIGNQALEFEIKHLHALIDAKNDIMTRYEEQIEGLKQHIITLERYIAKLENQQ